jgi:hypothetical protein
VFCDKIAFDINSLDINCIYYFPIYLYSNRDNLKILKQYPSRLSDKFMFVKTLCHQAMIYPREIFERHFYNESYKYISDWLLNLILFHLGYKFHFINHPFVIYDQNGLTGQGKSRLDFLNEKLNFQKENFPFRYLFYIRIKSFLKQLRNLNKKLSYYLFKQ